MRSQCSFLFYVCNNAQGKGGVCVWPEESETHMEMPPSQCRLSPAETLTNWIRSTYRESRISPPLCFLTYPCPRRQYKCLRGSEKRKTKRQRVGGVEDAARGRQKQRERSKVGKMIDDNRWTRGGVKRNKGRIRANASGQH